MEAALTEAKTTDTPRSMGRPPQFMREIKVQFPPEMLEQIDSLVGDKNRSKFIRAAVQGSLDAAKLVKSSDDKTGR